MKKVPFRGWKPKPVPIRDLDDRLLLINLYFTQILTFAAAMVVFAFERLNPLRLLVWPSSGTAFLWGAVFALLVLGADLLISRWVPEEMTDDGGINDMLFGGRAVWHIALISLVVSLCEELLFRGAVQHAWGPYWTSILFAGIHIRYLRHWLMTGMVFGISYGLGYLFDVTGSLWAPVCAHLIIDFTMGMILRFGRDRS